MRTLLQHNKPGKLEVSPMRNGLCLVCSLSCGFPFIGNRAPSVLLFHVLPARPFFLSFFLCFLSFFLFFLSFFLSFFAFFLCFLSLLSFFAFFLCFLSLLPCFLLSLLPCFLASLLPCFLASLLPCFLACLLPSFLPSFLPSCLFSFFHSVCFLKFFFFISFCLPVCLSFFLSFFLVACLLHVLPSCLSRLFVHLSSVHTCVFEMEPLDLLAGGSCRHRWHEPTKTHLSRRDNVLVLIAPGFVSGRSQAFGPCW